MIERITFAALLMLAFALAGCEPSSPEIRYVKLQDGTVLRDVTEFRSFPDGEVWFNHDGRKYRTTVYTSWTEPLPAEKQP